MIKYLVLLVVVLQSCSSRIEYSYEVDYLDGTRDTIVTNHRAYCYCDDRYRGEMRVLIVGDNIITHNVDSYGLIGVKDVTNE